MNKDDKSGLRKYSRASSQTATPLVNSAPLFPDVGLGILSWHAHRTLRRTLQSLADADLFSLFSESLIYFQEISDKDRVIAREFNLRAVGGECNIGIRGGMKALAESLQCKFVLHLENDFVLSASHAETVRQLTVAVRHLRGEDADLYRLHRRQEFSTHQKYLRYHAAPQLNKPETLLRILHRLLHPAKARRLQGWAVYMNAHPEKKFPRSIRRLDEHFFTVDSASMDWTNNPLIYPRQWFLNELIPFAESRPVTYTVNGFPDLECELDCEWWRAKHFRIGIAPGIFMHDRIDYPPNDKKNRRRVAAIEN